MVTNRPLVSVVVPLYNKELYVKRTIDSILAQSYDKFEVVVIDDGSTDESASIVSKITDGRVRIISQKNAGEGAARNSGIRESKGVLVAMLDADDEWHPDFLRAVVDLHQTYPEAGICATAYRTIYKRNLVVETTLSKDVFGGAYSGLVFDYFTYGRLAYFVWSSAQAVPRVVYNKVGLFVENEPMGPDLDMWGRIALHYPVAYDTRPLAFYHDDAVGRVVTQWAKQPTFPPFVRSARQAMKDNIVPGNVLWPLKDYLNHLLLSYLARVMASGDRYELKRALSSEFYSSPSYRLELAYLKVASRLMPMRLLYYLHRLRNSRYVGLYLNKEKKPVLRRKVRRSQR